MSWGHDYGGLVRIENRNSYPWEDRYSDLVLQEADPMYTADPIHNTEALNILTEQPSAPPQPKQPLLPPKAGHLGSSEGRDPLSLLPLEIRTTIATELSVADYLGTRLASRAMWPIFYYQTWWRKKFYAQTLGHEDRSWFIEAWDAPELLTVMDWRFLYRRTRHDQLSPGLRNRKRIWRLVHNIPNIVALDLEAQQDSPAITSDTASPRMIPRVEARLRPPRRGYESSDGFDGEGCREKFCQTVGIPADAASITVYTVPLGDASYICGLEVADEQGGTARAGYRSNCGLEVHLDGKLRGLVAAVGCRGLHAIQLVMIKNDGKGDGKKTTTTTTTSTTTSAWLGDAKADCPKTERLVSTGERVTHIEAHFDVSLARNEYEEKGITRVENSRGVFILLTQNYL